MGNAGMKGIEPVRPTMLPYGQQWIDEEDIEVVTSVLRGDYLTQGPNIEQFERAVADYVGAKYAVAFSSGTAALHGACYAAGIGPGDEVITTPVTFVASSNCVLYQGGTPVFVDIRPDTYNIDPDEIEKTITPRTKAIIPVDYTGQPAEMDRIRALAAKHRLIVIEDAAHSLGAEYNGRRVGTLADMTMFSFHPVKHVTSAEGGIIVTDNKAYYEKLQLFRSHGITKDPQLMEHNDGPWYYEMVDLGYHYRITDIQAALGASQMKKLDRFVARRREIARLYTEAFSQMEGLTVPYQLPEALSSWHLYMLRFDLNRFGVTRKEIFEKLRALNIGVHVHYIPVHKQPYYQKHGYGDVTMPNAEAFYDSCITLPLFPKMSDSDVNDVIEAVKKVCKMYIPS
jgi:UDP-4-amino-4,6-dideoxy-N-acetyl-beta-L-altrosamine transaminase